MITRGYSLGGAAVIFAANRMDHLKAVVTIGAPSSPKHVSHLLKERVDQIQRSGEAIVTIGSREFKIKKQFFNDIQEKNMI